jgi:4-amino-4-deoxy-L-arabinose transferase-like glycosyltransferase
MSGLIIADRGAGVREPALRNHSSLVFWVVLLGVLAWKAAILWRLDPCYDEGYYFYWSLFPQLSYFDQPPMSGWAITMSRLVLGDGIWAIRVWPLLVGVAFALLGRQLARRAFSREAGDLAGVLLTLMPGFAGNALLMTPDTFFALGWAGAVFFAWMALEPGRRRWLYWCLTGVAAGVGALSKYNMVLFFVGMGVLWLVSPGRRREVAAGTVVAGLIALAIFSPVIFWNHENHWASFRFQMEHGFTAKHGFLSDMLGYMGGFLLVATPVLAVQAFYSAGRAVRSSRWEERFLTVFFWVVVGFFAVSACRAKVQPNWAMLAFFTGLVLVAGRWGEFPQWARRLSLGMLLVTMGAAAVGMTFVAVASNRLAVSPQAAAAPRLAEFAGGRLLAQAVEKKRAETNTSFVCVARYQVLARLAFFAPALRQRLCLPWEDSRRFPWIDDRQWRGRDALLVVKSPSEAEEFAGWFGSIEEAGSVGLALEAKAGKAVDFYIGRGYRGCEAQAKGHSETSGGGTRPVAGHARLRGEKVKRRVAL